jgi:hypothetical protein
MTLVDEFFRSSPSAKRVPSRLDKVHTRGEMCHKITPSDDIFLEITLTLALESRVHEGQMGNAHFYIQLLLLQELGIHCTGVQQKCHANAR